MYDLSSLIEERGRLETEAETLHAGARNEKRGLTDEEKTRDDEIHDRLAVVNDDIRRAERARETARAAGQREFEADPPSGIEVVDRDFGSLGEQLVAIAQASMGHDPDPRLLAGASGASATVGSDAGFLIRKQFADKLFERSFDTGQLAAQCDTVPIGDGADGFEAPYIDETSRATGSRFGGVRVYRESETGTPTKSKPKFGKFALDLEDLKAIAYATDRSLRDARSLEAVYETAFSDEFGYALDEEIINGTGVGQCLGLMNSAALVSVAKEDSQVADTFVAGNAVKMFARVYRPHLSDWYVNDQVMEQLPLMTIGDRPVFIPPAGLEAAPLGTLLGRPIHSLEQCNKLGDKGDIFLLNMKEYLLIRKDGLQADSSIHVRFLQNEKTFRWIMRVNGAPKWRTSLTPANANTGFKKSPFITLDARA